MRKRTLWVTAAGLAAMLVAGGLYASNMGFKLNYPLDAPPTSLDGTNVLALPFNQQTNLGFAADLMLDIDNGEPAPIVLQVCRWVKGSNGLSCYLGGSGDNFALVPGDAYMVQVSANGNYIVVGSHDPNKGVALDAPPTSLDGTNLYAMPYHTTLTDAAGLMGEIGQPPTLQVCRWVNSSNGLSCYLGGSGDNFTLTPGAGYYVQVSSNVTYTPSHY